jgi:hypothetical protein
LLEPNVDETEEYREELHSIIRQTAVEGNYKADWFNDEM